MYTATRLRDFAASCQGEMQEVLLHFVAGWQEEVSKLKKEIEDVNDSLNIEVDKVKMELENEREKPRAFLMYQIEAEKTAVYPEAHKIIYPTMGLAGEAGEVANTVSKMLRDGELNVSRVVGEMGDVLWFLSQLATDLQISLEDVAWINIRKLRRRAEEGKLRGSGSDR